MSDAVGVPENRTREFKNLDALLDYCKWVQPKVFTAVVLSSGICRLVYSKSEGHE